MPDSDLDSENPPDTCPVFPTPFQRKTVWAAITGVSMVVIGAIAVGLIVMVAKILQVLQPVLVPFAAAGIIAYLIEPLVLKLIDRGIPRIRAILTVFCGFSGGDRDTDALGRAGSDRAGG